MLANTNQSDFCIDITAIDNIMQKYNTAFDDMVRQQNEIQAAFDAVKINGCLKGRWFESYMKTYETWSESYNRLLAVLILFCASLSEAKDYTKYLIEERDALEKALQI